MLHWFETIDEKDVMITDHYGLSLEEVFRRSGCYFSMQRLLLFADQLLSRVEFIHSRNIIHGNLNPWSFALGDSGWQSQQVLLVDFNTDTTPNGSARCDLHAIGHILAYFYSGAGSWEGYQRGPGQSSTSTAPVFSSFLNEVSICKSIDYGILRKIFRSAYQDLATHLAVALDLKGPRAIRAGFQPNTSTLSTIKTDALFERLSLMLAEAGERARDVNTILSPQTCVQLLEYLEEILGIYIVLLARDCEKEEQLMGTYPLPNRLWRDLVEFLSNSSNASSVFQLAITGKIYKFVAFLYEAFPDYKSDWTEYLLTLARARKKVEPSCGRPAWTQAVFYWQDQLNQLKTEGLI
jgi:hypothetical protein